MNESEPPAESQAAPEPAPKPQAAFGAASAIESRRRDPADRTSEARPDSSAYRIERQAILLRRKRWEEAARDARERARSADAPAAATAAAPGAPASAEARAGAPDSWGLAQYERPRPGPAAPPTGVRGWIGRQWRGDKP